MKKPLLSWRKATEEEIEKGLDHPINKGMLLVSEGEIDVVDEEKTEPIDISNLSDEQVRELKERINNIE